MIADWSQVLDGIVFTRQMFPSTRVGQTVPTEQEQAPELLAFLESDWSRASLRLAAEQPFADKVSFFMSYRRWKQSATRSPEELQAADRAVEAWCAGKPPSADLAWRADALLARIAADRGEAALAMERIDRAIEAYPVKTYAQPANHSFFQHLVNEKAMLIWEQQGPDAAIEYVAGMLATDRRFDYFFSGPWRKRLSGPENLDRADRMRRSVIEAYERRAEEFPDVAEAAAGYARELRGSR
jgi:tetratricopeptide (TPR) repeat protein